MDIWVLDDALNLIRAIQEDLKRYGYHVALGGGVLNRGTSAKDLDLYFLPMNDDGTRDAPALLTFLRSLWGPYEDINPIIKRDPWGPRYVQMQNGELVGYEYVMAPLPPVRQEYPHDVTYKHKVKFLRGDQGRIDAFIV